jgi:peroxiredoxin
MLKTMINLKITAALAFAALSVAGCQEDRSDAAGSEFKISGELENITSGQVYLHELQGQQMVARDTATIGADGTFTFDGNVTEPTLYRISTNQQNGLMLVLDGGNVEVKADASDINRTAKIEGSKESLIFQDLNRIVNETGREQMELEQRFNKAMTEGNTEAAEAARVQYMSLQNKVKDFLAKHPKSVVSAFGTATLIDPMNDFAFADSMANLYNQYIPDSRYTKMLNERIQPFKNTAIGSMAPDIKLATPEGGEKSLSSLRGKYVLIDFWASWCAPCRKENPNVVRMYNEYKDKGFEIFGVSLDQSRDKWLKAIADDKLTWPQVSDLKGWESAAAQKYNITAIPQTILLDKEGKIIAKGLRGDELEQKLESLLK